MTDGALYTTKPHGDVYKRGTPAVIGFGRLAHEHEGLRVSDCIHAF